MKMTIYLNNETLQKLIKENISMTQNIPQEAIKDILPDISQKRIEVPFEYTTLTGFNGMVVEVELPNV